MNKKIRIMWIFNILMTICYVAAVIVKIFSITGWWILLCVWGIFAIATIVSLIIVGIGLKRL